MLALHLSLDLPGDYHFISLTRRLSRSLLEAMDVIPEDTDAVELILGELCANVVRHACDSALPGEDCYRLGIEYKPAKIVLTIEDRGPGFDPKSVAEPGTLRPDSLATDNASDAEDAGAERIGGFGLPLIAALSDHLSFTATDPTGTTVRAEKTLNYLTEPR